MGPLVPYYGVLHNKDFPTMTNDINEVSDGRYVPAGSWLVTLGSMDYEDGKAPTQSFGGWNVETGPVPGGKQACWDHEGTWDIGDVELRELAESLQESNRTAFLLDIDGANLLILDHDVDEETDKPENGKWGSAQELEEYIADTFPGQTTWGSQSGGIHVPILLTDEAYESVFNNEWQAGYGVDALKGPAAKGYTAAPLSPGYSVLTKGGMPLLDVDDLEDADFIKRSGTTGSAADPADFEATVDRETAHTTESTDDMDMLLSAINQLRPSDFRMKSTRTVERVDDVIAYDQSWRSTETGTSLQWLPDEGIFYDHREGKGMFADKLVALEEGLINSPHDKLSAGDWWEAVDLLRERGAPVPEWDGAQDDPFSGDGVPQTVSNGYDQTPDARSHEAFRRVKRVTDETLLNPFDDNYDLEIPMRAGKSGKFAEGASQSDRRLHVTPNKDQARDSAREYGPNDQRETIPSTDSWLADEDQVGEVVANEFMHLIVAGFQAARARAYLMQRYDIEAPDVEPYFEQYEEDPTESLILTSPGVEAVQHWNEAVDSIGWDDVHPAIHYSHAFRLNDNTYEDGVRPQLDKVVRALPVAARSLDELLEDTDECKYIEDDVTLVTSPHPAEEHQFNLMELARQSDVTMQTWKQLMAVIEHETGIDATGPGIAKIVKRDDDRYIWIEDPMIPSDVNMVIMSGDQPPDFILELWEDVTGRDFQKVRFRDETLQGYWRYHKHNVVIADAIENTRSGGNINPGRSHRLEEFARRSFPELGRLSSIDALKAFERRGYSRDEIKASGDKMHFGKTRGNSEFDDRRLLVVHGAGQWPNFVEDMCELAEEPVELVQEGAEPLEAREPGTDTIHPNGQAALHWMRQADVTQACARAGSDADGPTVVVVGTRHVGRQFNAYDVSDDVELLNEAEADTIEAVERGYATISGVASARGVTEQAAGHVLNKLAERGVLDKDEYAEENGQHGFEDTGNKYLFSVPSNDWTRHVAPLAESVSRDSIETPEVEMSDPMEQLTLSDAV